MLNKKTIFMIIALILFILTANFIFADLNKYEKQLYGAWKLLEEPDIIVFDKNNICYIVDEDGIRQTENGRWKATSNTVAMALKYNGKRYRSEFEYEFIGAFYLEKQSFDDKSINSIIDKVSAKGVIEAGEYYIIYTEKDKFSSVKEKIKEININVEKDMNKDIVRLKVIRNLVDGEPKEYEQNETVAVKWNDYDLD
ncbi:MAG: hypothetical protein ACOCV8_01025 [Spirochaetota bacterium]